MQRLEVKSIGFYLLWLGCFGIALIALPYSLGSFIAHNEWQMIGFAVLGITVSTLYFIEARYLILCTAICLIFADSRIVFVSESFMTIRWVFLIALAIRALAHWILGRVPTRLRGIDLWILSFLALAFYSQTYSIAPSLTLQRSASALLLYLAIFWGVWNYVQDTTKILIVISDFLKASFLLFLLGFLFIGNGRFAGLFTNPNGLGLFTSLLTPLAVGIFLLWRKPWLAYLILTIGINLLLCGSRGAIFAVGIGTAYVLWYYYRDQKHFILTFPLFFLLLCLLYTALFDWSWLAGYLRWDTLSVGGGRWEGWREVLRLIKLRPWLGYGFGTEDRLFYAFDIFFLYHAGAYAHNSYLGLASQLGLVGVFLLFAPLTFFLIRNSRQIAHTPSRELGLLQSTLTGSIIAGLVHAIFESWIYSVGNAFAFLFWIIVVFAYRLDSASHPKKSDL